MFSPQQDFRPSPKEQYVIGLFVLVAVLIFARFHFEHILGFPLATYDDGLGGLGNTLLLTGHYGDVTVPVTLGGLPRTEGFFLYGPWGFLGGAFQSWLSQSFISGARGVYFTFTLLMGGMAFWQFRRISSAAWGAVWAVALFNYWMFFWINFRPESISAPLTILALVFGQRAFLSKNALYWFFCALFIFMAGSAHHIAATMALLPFLLFFIARLVAPKPPPYTILYAIFGAGFLTLFAHLYAMDGKIPTFLHFIKIYIGNRPDITDTEMTLGALIFDQAARTWGLLKIPAMVVWSVLAGIILIVLLLPSRKKWATLLAWLLPPFVAMLLFALSNIIIFKTKTATYLTTAHFITAWMAGSLIVALHSLDFKIHYKQFGERMFMVTVLLLLILTILGPYYIPYMQRKTIFARSAPAFKEISHQVTSWMPDGSRVWAPNIFGLGQEKRLELVHFQNGFELLHDFSLEQRSPLLPQYMVFSPLILPQFALHALPNAKKLTLLPLYENQALDEISEKNLFQRFYDLFPYGVRVTRYIHAPRYGIYQILKPNHQSSQISPEALAILPKVSSYRAWDKKWIHDFQAPKTVLNTPVKPGSFVLYDKKRRYTYQAKKTIRIPSLERNVYLLDIRLQKPASVNDAHSKKGGWLVAHATPTFKSYIEWDETGTLAQHGMLYAYGQTQLFMLYDHPGGPFYLSHLLGEPTSFTLKQIYPLATPPAGAWKKISLPPWSQWTVKEGSAIPKLSPQKEGGRMTLSSKAVGQPILLESPPLKIEKGSEVVLDLPMPPLYYSAVEVRDAKTKRTLVSFLRGDLPLRFTHHSENPLQMIWRYTLHEGEPITLYPGDIWLRPPFTLKDRYVYKLLACRTDLGKRHPHKDCAAMP
ncbi:hypothetical protein ACQZV8_02360 [Magnetococcales bacterium HHB-1]